MRAPQHRAGRPGQSREAMAPVVDLSLSLSLMNVFVNSLSLSLLGTLPSTLPMSFHLIPATAQRGRYWGTLHVTDGNGLVHLLASGRDEIQSLSQSGSPSCLLSPRPRVSNCFLLEAREHIFLALWAVWSVLCAQLRC